ncbi:MAG: sugar ABC transporter substrate-binding protein [Clostridiales bacterium]|nr:sugar ABC transporter substrate-binding protein [Clostridiales bacterium]
MKKLVGMLLVVAMMVSMMAFATAEEIKANEEYTIAFSLKTVTNDAFQQAIANAVEKEATEAGCKFQLVTAGSETGVATQVTQIEDLITADVDALVINPMDANAVIPALEKAKEKGIPVVLVDSSIEAGHEDLYVTYIGTDNYAAAKQGAEVLSEALGGTGKAILVRGANGNSVGNARADGFKAGLAEGIELVGEQPGDWSNDVAKQVTENMLQANPDVVGIMSCSDVMVDGILQAIDDADLSGIKIMSFDGDSIELIQQGLVLGTMAQFPAEMGKLAVDTLVQVLNGDKAVDAFDKYIDSGTACYTAENLPE